MTETATAPRRPLPWDDDAPAVITARTRAQILDYASDVTAQRYRADRVCANAAPLIDWISQATTTGDLKARMEALGQQHHNAIVQTRGYRPDDNTDLLLDGARALYAFMTAGK